MNRFLFIAKLWVQLASWKKIFIALLLGIIVGALLGKSADILKPIGSLFINAVHLIVAPVVFTAIVTAILSLKDNSNVRRLTLVAICLYLILMLISASIGCALSYFLHPGLGFKNLPWFSSHTLTLGKVPTFADFVSHLLPENSLLPFLQSNVLQLILFAILFASAIKIAGESAAPVANFFVSLNKVIYQLTSIVISFAPYGIFALISWTVGNFGLKIIMPLLALVGVVYLGCLFLLLIVYPMMIACVAKKNPIKFYQAMFPALAFAFTSSSSAATLPVTMRCAEEKFSLPSHVAKFLLPLGASFNLNGLSVYLSVATVFAANLYGIHLGLAQYLTIVLTITLTAMGAAAVPGSALIVMGAVMGSVGIPLNAIAIIAGVDRLNDMMQTMTNVAGDMCVGLVVANQR